MQKANERKIAIIGGGPGGLTLAVILQKYGVKATVYEKSSFQANNQQGGSLDIHSESGQRALQEADLFESFQAVARYDGEDFRLFDKKGKMYLDEIAEDHDSDRPEIDRGVLCEMILQALDPTSIRWNHSLSHVVPLKDDLYELHFENGNVETANLVIGADGAFSKVRPLLTKAKAEYTGLSMVEVHIKNVDIDHPELASFNRRGKMFALADHKAIIGQLNGDGDIRVYASFQVEQEWLDQSVFLWDQPDIAKQKLLSYFEDWDDSLRNYICLAEGQILPRRIYMLPVGLTWAHRAGVTLIGDAAHLMSPFAGEGVNLAMLDATELALSIVQHNDLSIAVQSYEQKMYAYSGEAARESYENLQLCFGDQAASRLAALMNQYHQQA